MNMPFGGGNPFGGFGGGMPQAPQIQMGSPQQFGAQPAAPSMPVPEAPRIPGSMPANMAVCPPMPSMGGAAMGAGRGKGRMGPGTSGGFSGGFPSQPQPMNQNIMQAAPAGMAYLQ